MRNVRLLVLVAVIFAIAGFAAGWWYRDRSDDSIERRAREAAGHMRDAARALTH